MILKTPQSQHGAALLIMMIILVLGAAAMLLNSLNSTTPRLARDQVTAAALAQAKDALIGYAITYGDTNPNTNGFLPCPDEGQNNTEDGEAKSDCGTANVTAIGKFPWKTLKSSTLKDGNGECLWYAVSGNYKNNPNTELMNWDNNGLLQALSPDGVTLVPGSSTNNQPVAVIFSPGPPLATQTRNSLPKAASCGGNYTTSNYLDNDTIHNINNAVTSITANSVTQLISGPVKDLSGNEIVNDRMLIITKDDIFTAIKKRSDFVTFINTMLNSAKTCLTPPPPTPPTPPTPLTSPVSLNFGITLDETPGGITIGNLELGRAPKSCLTTPYNNWQDNILYARCSSGSSCLNVNGAACRGLIIFTGERTTSQLRASNLQKNTWSNYLEDTPNNNLTSFSTGSTTFSSSPSYSSTSPSTDVIACIP